jgi:uncharacterized protein
MLLRKIVTAGAALFCTVIFPYAAQAASFDCAKARSKQEKLICSTPVLSQADDVMAAKYKEAHVVAAKISQDEASQIKADQAGWILSGIHDCTPDIKCLSSSYKKRIAFLDFYLHQTQSPIAASGTYDREIIDNGGELQIQLKDDNKVVFSISLDHVMNRGTPYFTANGGDLAGEAPLKNNMVDYEKKLIEESAACKLQISFSATKAVIKENGQCGFGLGVFAEGVYFKTSNAVPEIKIDPKDPDHVVN